jgi:hypothetical protein
MIHPDAKEKADDFLLTLSKRFQGPSISTFNDSVCSIFVSARSAFRFSMTSMRVLSSPSTTVCPHWYAGRRCPGWMKLPQYPVPALPPVLPRRFVQTAVPAGIGLWIRLVNPLYSGEDVQYVIVLHACRILWPYPPDCVRNEFETAGFIESLGCLDQSQSCPHW